MPDVFPDLGRLVEPAIAVLVSLSDGPKHGYVIMSDAEVVAGAPIGPGTLYAVLARLEQQGLIEALEPEDRRRPYRLTSTGADALETHLAAMATLVRTGQTRLEANR